MHAHTCHTAAATVSCCRCSGARLQPHHGGGAGNGGQLILGDGLQEAERRQDDAMSGRSLHGSQARRRAACSTFVLDTRPQLTHHQQAAARATEEHEHSSSSGRLGVCKPASLAPAHPLEGGLLGAQEVCDDAVDGAHHHVHRGHKPGVGEVVEDDLVLQQVRGKAAVVGAAPRGVEVAMPPLSGCCTCQPNHTLLQPTACHQHKHKSCAQPATGSPSRGSACSSTPPESRQRAAAPAPPLDCPAPTCRLNAMLSAYQKAMKDRVTTAGAALAPTTLETVLQAGESERDAAPGRSRAVKRRQAAAALTAWMAAFCSVRRAHGKLLRCC